MPGINRTGSPNTRDYSLGRGFIRFGKNDSATGLPDADGLRDLGNTPEFTVTQTTEDLKHQSSRECLKFTDKRFVLSQEVGISFQLDETRNFDNLAFFFSGDTEVYVNPHTVAISDVVQATSVKKGNWYEMRNAAGARIYNLDAAGLVYVLEKTDFVNEINTLTAHATTPATAGDFTLTVNGQTTAPIVFNATAAQVQTALENLSNVLPGDVAAVASVGANLGIANTVITLTWGGELGDEDITITADFTGLTSGSDPVLATGTAGGTGTTDLTLVEGTHVEIDEQMGLFRVLSTANAVPEGSVIKLTITSGATARQDLDQVNALTEGEISGTLLFIQDNTGDCGQKLEFRFHQVSISPDGELALISDEVATAGFTGTAEVNSLVTDTSKVCTVRTYDMV
jgi:hypothetical protein